MDPERAFLVVNAFLRGLWERTKQPGELGVFLTMIDYEPGDGSLDPAMWFDWLVIVKLLQTGVRVSDRESAKLTADAMKPMNAEQAYLAMFLFIEEYWIRVSRPEEIGDLLNRMRYTPGSGTAD